MHNDAILPDFSVFTRTAAGAPLVPPRQPLAAGPPLPEPPDHSLPLVPGSGPGQAAGQGPAASGRAAAASAHRVRSAAPPFSWLGVDAWPALPGVADQQV